MDIKRILFFILTLIIFSAMACTQKQQSSGDLQMNAFIDDLMGKMTLEEKLGQLNLPASGDIITGAGSNNNTADKIKEGKVGGLFNIKSVERIRAAQQIAVEQSRLKIPMIFGMDVIHGYQTLFPIPLGMSCSWDMELIEKSARVAAQEASADGICWTFSPMVDISRDPRWGRVSEGSGEDPYLGSLMAAARVRGYQENLSNLNIIACAKHYAGYGGAEGGRDYNTVDFSERTFRDVYLPPFKAAVDAGAHTIMASFNEIGGIPSSGSKRLLTDILRDEWGFKGFVVSDWNSIGELINHGFASDLKHAGQISLNAGLDMDMESRSYITHLKELEDEGKVDEDLIDESVKRILRVKFMLGLFDDPYRYCQKEREQKNIMTDEVRIAALEVAKRSMVLLKNEKNILPLKKTYKRIGVIGPLANSKTHPLGGWSAMGDSVDVTTVLEGLKNYVDKKIDIAYAEGCKIDDNSTAGFKNAVNIAKKSDVVVLCLGESRDMSGEACSRSSLDLPGVQEALAKELKKTGKPIVVVLMNGRPLSIPWLNDNANAILEAWFSGVTAGEAIAKVLFGDYNPGGKLPVTFPRTVGQVPIYYNHKNTGRSGDLKNHYTSKYLDLPLTPLYPFGYGLSYTTFSLNDFNLSSGNLTEEDSIIVSVKVKNTGNYDGEEVVQLYIQDLVGSVTRPVKELKGFKKVMLKRGEEKSVQFTIHEKDLRFTTADMKFKSEPGKFKAFVGANSADALEKEFELVE